MRLLGFRKPRRKDEDAMRFMQTQFSDRELSRPFERLVEDHTGEISTKAVTGESVAKMSRKNFLRYSALLGIGAALGSKLLPVMGSPPNVNWNLGAGSLVLPSSYVMFQDGTVTIFTRNGLSGKVDNNSTDFGAMFNYVITQLPVTTATPFDFPQGGLISIKRASATYKYSTTPLTTLSGVCVRGEGKGTVLEPSAAVDGLTFRSPAGAAMANVEVRDLAVWDAAGNGNGKAYIKLDTNTNNSMIIAGLFQNLYHYGSPSGISTGKFISHNGANIVQRLQQCVFDKIWASRADTDATYPRHVVYATDTFGDFGSFIDCIFSNWFTLYRSYNGANPIFKINLTGTGSGSYFYNMKFLMDAAPSITAVVSLNGTVAPAALYFEDLFFESGTGNTNLIVLQIAGTASEEFHLRRFRAHWNGAADATGIQWTATAAHDGTTLGDCYLSDVNIVNFGTALKSVAGDASLKVFRDGHLKGNTTTFSPNPLTGAVFYKMRINDALVQGFGVTTPAIPATGTPLTNGTGFDVIVFLRTQSVTAIAVDGTDTGWGGTLPTDLSFTIPAGQTVTLTYVGTAPTWKWYGV